MYFVLSKLLGFLVDPVRLALVLLAIAGILRLIKRLPRLRRGLAIAAVVVVWVFSTGLVSTFLANLLERQHHRPQRLDTTPGAIVMLTGQTDDGPLTPSYYELTGAADRFVETMRLAHKYPRALVVLSGGSGALRPDGRQREAQVLGRLAEELGIHGSRLMLDDQSRNTRENAVETKRLLAKKTVRGKILLVTSAVHMPRSLGCFQRAGLKVVPWPVDYIRHGVGLGALVPKADPLIRNRAVLHELAGLLVYWLMGYT